MIATVTNHISKGVENINDGTRFNWFKTNFNMPVGDYMDDNNPFNRYEGAWDYLDEQTSYDLSGFSPGYEICVAHAIFDFENNSGSTYNLNTQLTLKWVDTNGTTSLGQTVTNISTSIAPGEWIEYWFARNIGVAGWEIDSNANYFFKSKAVGTPNISEVSTTVGFSNVPSVTELGVSKQGYIWVEGNNLCFVNGNEWKHTIVGNDLGDVGADPGYIWIDSGDDLAWIGADGHYYYVSWKVKQFASFFSNSATGSTFAGTSKVGFIWVDTQFGWTHLSYIASDGFKYLTGAGDDPYN